MGPFQAARTPSIPHPGPERVSTRRPRTAGRPAAGNTLWAAYAVAAAAWAVAALLILAPPLREGAPAPFLRIGLLLLLGAVTLRAVRAASRAALASRASYVQMLERMALVDDLTGLANRRAFTERLSLEMLRAQRYGRPLALVMLDLDGFKSVNDTFGHVAGDTALTAFGALLQEATRATDLAARLGGDEFALLLVEADAGAAATVVERLRQTVAARLALILPGAGEVRVALSAGIATLTADTDDETALVEAADRGLYEDKRARREATWTPGR